MASMHRWLNRGYAIFYMTLTAVCFDAFIGAIIAYSSSLSIPATFKITNISSYHQVRRASREQTEEAILQLNIDCDFSKFFNVNIRQYYTFIEAEWNTTDNGVHTDIIWNHLVKRHHPHLKVDNAFGHFPLRQVGPATIKGKTVKLSLKIQQIPFVGFFRTATLAQSSFTLPKNYTNPKLTQPTPVPIPCNDVSEDI